MYLLKAPIYLAGKINLPASKSICNRALIINALSDSPYEISNLSNCDDTQAVVRVLNSNDNHFDIGAAGTAMRFLTAFLSKIAGEWTITGTERMKNRPIKILVEALNSLGANISYVEKEGFPPLKIKGSALLGGEITLDGSVSSQYVTALMMIAPLIKEGLTIHLKGYIASKSYIRMTIRIMEEFGVKALFDDKKITILPQEYKCLRYTVESDWSAASYWYEIMALMGEGEIFLSGLQENSSQGDMAAAKLFSLLGVQSNFTKDGVLLTTKNERISKLIYDFTDQPDLVQTFVVTCCLLNVTFSFSGLSTLKIKETDRIAALIAEMKKLGYVLKETEENTLTWNGEKVKQDDIPVIETYEDHRMAMAFAPACIKIKNLCIQDPQVVSKSYPNFWDDLKNVGFDIKDTPTVIN